VLNGRVAKPSSPVKRRAATVIKGELDDDTRSLSTTTLSEGESQQAMADISFSQLMAGDGDMEDMMWTGPEGGYVYRSVEET